MKISVLINTFNEERNIKNCLESVKWADEIILVDMHSYDKTVEIARNYTNKIYFFERKGYADPARQYTLEKATHDWILIIDADEIVPLKLKNKLSDIMDQDLADVIYVPHKNYFCGAEIKEMGWGALQDKHPRFFKKGYVNLTDAIHEFYNITENARIYNIENLEESFIHFTYIDFEHYINKSLNNYTSIEAENVYEQKKKMVNLGNNFLLIMFRLLRQFINLYILKKGYKDGFRGLSISFLSVTYTLVTNLKFRLMQEYESKNPRDKILAKYQKIANSILSEYEK